MKALYSAILLVSLALVVAGGRDLMPGLGMYSAGLLLFVDLFVQGVRRDN